MLIAWIRRLIFVITDWREMIWAQKGTENMQIRRESLLHRMRKDFITNKYVYLMLIPVLAFYIVFKLGPMTRMVIAFQDYKPFKGIAGSEFILFENFTTFFNSRDFWRLLRNTLLLSLYGLIFRFPVSILFALMINEIQHSFGKRIVQTVSYMPHFISTVVICGLIRNFVSSEGIVNQIINFFNVARQGENLLGNPVYYRSIHVLSDIWQQTGWDSILYLATLSTIDPEQYEAAYIDGANKLQRIFHVTLPGLVPVSTRQFIMWVGFTMTLGYEKNLLLYNPAIYETADVIGTYMYRYCLMNTKYGLGAAVGVFNTVVNIILLFSVNALFKRFSENSLW